MSKKKKIDYSGDISFEPVLLGPEHGYYYPIIPEETIRNYYIQNVNYTISQVEFSKHANYLCATKYNSWIDSLYNAKIELEYNQDFDELLKD